MSSYSIKLIVLSFIVFAATVTAFGQGGATGAITGTVQDPSGAVIAKAEVRITNQDTNVLERTVTTGPDGSFTAPLLPVGSYMVSIQSAGFAEGKFPNVAVRVTETTRMIAKLSTKAVKQQIEDVSFLKHFKIGERQEVRFAADFFNLWNHTNFADPSVTDVQSYLASGYSSFGKILGTNGNPRLIQFSLRWAF